MMLSRVPSSPSAIQRGIVLFWAFWWTVVVASNLTDLATVLGVLPADFGWTSGNFAMMAGEDAGTPAANGILVIFILGILWETVAAVMMWRAGRWPSDLTERKARWRQAFFVALAFWAAFLVMDEVALVHKQGVPVMHLMAMVLHLASLTTIEVLQQAEASA